MVEIVLGTIDPWVATGSGRDPKIQKSVATQKKNPVTTDHGSRPKIKFRSRPTTGRDPEKISGRDRSDPRYNF
jgi:hypothetical protein